jgi:hypothetical protein
MDFGILLNGSFNIGGKYNINASQVSFQYSDNVVIFEEEFLSMYRILIELILSVSKNREANFELKDKIKISQDTNISYLSSNLISNFKGSIKDYLNVCFYPLLKIYLEYNLVKHKFTLDDLKWVSEYTKMSILMDIYNLWNFNYYIEEVVDGLNLYPFLNNTVSGNINEITRYKFMLAGTLLSDSNIIIIDDINGYLSLNEIRFLYNWIQIQKRIFIFLGHLSISDNIKKKKIIKFNSKTNILYSLDII